MEQEGYTMWNGPKGRGGACPNMEVRTYGKGGGGARGLVVV